jgi:predicted nucleic acid-binding protein
MPRLKLYLDTSAISLLFQNEAAERQAITRDFFQNVVEPRLHDISISAVVLDEIGRTVVLERRTAMLDLVARLRLPLLEIDPLDDAIRRLADLYIQLHIVPPGKRRDALHVAIATVHERDILVTWNYRHLAGVDREARIARVNVSEGFTKPLRLVTPMEVAYP